MLNRLLIILATTLLLGGCGQGKSPDAALEVAVQGAYSIRFNSEGDSAFVGSLHHGGSFWTLSPLERHFDWNHTPDGFSNLQNASFSTDGKYVTTTDNRTIVLWDISTGKAIWYWNAPGDIQDIALTKNGNLALLGMSDYTATLFDIRNGGIKRRFAHDGLVYDVSVSADASLAASASDDLTASVWNLNDGSKERSLKHDNQVKTAQLSPSGRLLFTSALAETGKLWDVASGKLLFEIPNRRGHFMSARFDRTEKRLLVGHSNGLVQLWGVSSKTKKGAWKITAGSRWLGRAVAIEDLAFTSKGYIAAGANGQIFQLTD